MPDETAQSVQPAVTERASCRPGARRPASRRKGWSGGVHVPRIATRRSRIGPWRGSARPCPHRGRPHGHGDDSALPGRRCLALSEVRPAASVASRVALRSRTGPRIGPSNRGHKSKAGNPLRITRSSHVALATPAGIEATSRPLAASRFDLGKNGVGRTRGRKRRAPVALRRRPAWCPVVRRRRIPWQLRGNTWQRVTPHGEAPSSRGRGCPPAASGAGSRTSCGRSPRDRGTCGSCLVRHDRPPRGASAEGDRRQPSA